MSRGPFWRKLFHSFVVNTTSVSLFEHVYVLIYSTPSLQVRCNTNSIFKWSIACLNSVFSSSRLVASSKLKKPVCPIYPSCGCRLDGFVLFISALVQREKQAALSRFETWSPIPFPMMIAFKLSLPLCVCVCMCVYIYI